MNASFHQAGLQNSMIIMIHSPLTDSGHHLVYNFLFSGADTAVEKTKTRCGHFGVFAEAHQDCMHTDGGQEEQRTHLGSIWKDIPEFSANIGTLPIHEDSALSGSNTYGQYS
jgi:hypothetical protein